MTTIALLGILLTGNYPGIESVGLEEDHPAVVRMIDLHNGLDNHDNIR